MSLVLSHRGRFGNQLFQVWVAVYIAEKLHRRLSIVDVPYLEYQLPFFKNTLVKEDIQGPRINFPDIVTRQSIDDVITYYYSSTIEILVICGTFFESSELVYSFKDYIESIYTFPKLKPVDRIAIHCRLDDLAKY